VELDKNPNDKTKDKNSAQHSLQASYCLLDSNYLKENSNFIFCLNITFPNECMISITSKNSSYLKTNPSVSALQEALDCLLLVPDERVKPVIIQEIMRYYQAKKNAPNYPLALYIAYKENSPVGMVIAQMDPEYRTYSRKATTFGWLLCEDFNTCKELMNCVEEFARNNKQKKIRGPINYPKIIGGIGIQTEGFEVPILNGVNFNASDSRVLNYLNSLGYESESKYSCVDVVSKKWNKGHSLDSDYYMRYFTVTELRNMKTEIMELATHSFYSILADAPGGESRFEEMMRSYELVSSTPFDKQVANRIIMEHAHVPEFLEAWKSCKLEKIVSWAPCAFKRDTGELVGIILSLPNLYQYWAGEVLTVANADTVMVHKDHSGKGIFSALHNIGRLTVEMFGIQTAEGTTIWANNSRAIQTIFPHSTPLRTHVVVQKRVK